jgi:tetratricopeptide (TPR) repeat protein
LYREALARATERGYLDIMIYAGGNLGRLALLRGQAALAKPQLEKAAALARESGNRVTLADWLSPLGRAALYRREFQQATIYLQECYDLWQEMGIAAGQAEALTALAELALARGNLDTATPYLRASLALWLDLWQRQSHQLTAMLRGLVDCWLAVGCLAGEIRPSPEVVAILAAAEQIRSSIEYRLDPAVEVARQLALKTARETLSPAEFEAAWAKGQSLGLDGGFNLAYRLLE